DGPLPAPRATGSGLARGLPAHVLAAIGSEVGAGDPGGLLGQEECNRVSDFLRGAEPAERDLRHDLLADMLGYRHHHVGADVAGRYGVDGDAVAGVLLRQGNGEAMHAGLGRRVVGLAVLALLAVDGADLHDAAPLALAHPVYHRPGDVEHRVEVGEIGRASCRERVEMWVVDVAVNGR